MAEKPNFYAILPANVRYDERLRPNAKLLYAEITALCSKSGFCTAQNDYFSTLYKITKKTVSELIGQLVARGYLKLEVLRDTKGQVSGRRIWLPDAPEEGESLYPAPKNRDTPADGIPDLHPEMSETLADTPKKAVLQHTACALPPKSMDTSPEKSGDPTPKNRDTSPENSGDPPPKNREVLKGLTIQDITNTPIAPTRGGGIWRDYAGDDGELLQALCDFEKLRRQRKKPMSDRAKKMLLNALEKHSGGSRARKLEMLETSILHCWDTVYPPKEPAPSSVGRSELEDW